jgi:hypothetical protein
MYHPTHDPAIIRHMIDEGYAHADSDRLAALARSRRTHRPSFLERLGGRVASFQSALSHRPVTRPTARTSRP